VRQVFCSQALRFFPALENVPDTTGSISPNQWKVNPQDNRSRQTAQNEAALIVRNSQP